MPEHTFPVLPESAGKRLDIVIAAFCRRQKTGLSRTAAQALIRGGRVKVNSAVCGNIHFKLKAGDEVFFSFDEKIAGGPEPEEIALEVVYEDDDLAVIVKQPGIVVHPAPGNQEHTLVNALLHRFKPLSSVNPERPGIVHRLDKETSGLLVVAKTNHAHLELAAQFAAHSIKRVYYAIVSGRVEFDEQVIEAPIGRHPVRRKEMAVSFTGAAKDARTRYKTLKRSDDCSLLELHPFTGRTHQLRVHLAHIGHPILGDVKYGKRTPFPRLALHAAVLGFIHPRTGAYMEFSAPLPKEFDSVCPPGRSARARRDK